MKKNNIILYSKPSNWIKKYLNININKDTLLDVACGNGRHSFYAASLGYKVFSIDIDKDKLSLTNFKKHISPILLNIEEENSWPFIKRSFDTVIVTNYLYRPVYKNIINSIKPNGTLLYETFSEENTKFGRPNNPDYLLKPIELLKLAKQYKMEIIDFEEILLELPKKKAIQRIYAKKN